MLEDGGSLRYLTFLLHYLPQHLFLALRLQQLSVFKAVYSHCAGVRQAVHLE